MRKRGILGASLAVLVILVMAGSWKRADGSSDAQAAAVPVWAKRIQNSYGGIRTFRGLPDSLGGCLAVGDSGFLSNLDGWAVHLDKTGKILNQMTYGGTKHERLISICESVDTGYLAAGRTQFDPSGGYEKGGYGLLMKLGADLNPIWAKTVSASRTGNWIERILKLNKAQGYLAIMTFVESRYCRAIMRLNSSGSVVWAFKLGDDKLSFDIREVLQAPDGGFFLVGEVSSSWEDDAVIIKIDGNGHFKWAKEFGEAGTISERIESAYLTGSNNLMVFGVSFKNWASLALKLDLNGNVKWQYLYKGPPQIPGGLRYGMPGEGGGFYFMGSDTTNDPEIVFAKCDSTGKILSKKYYPAFGGFPNWYERMSHAFRSSDGGIFILNSAVPPWDVAIAKLNTTGNLPKKCPPMSWNVARSKTKYKLIDISIPYASVKVTVKSTKISAKSVSYASSEACD